MKVTIFNEITTEDALQQLEESAEKYTDLYCDMNNKDERKFVKDKAALIKGIREKLNRARIDKTREFREQVEAEAKSIDDRLAVANRPFTKLIDDHKAERAKILAEKKAKEEAEALAIQIEEDHEIALLFNSEFDRKAEAEEKARLEREGQLKKQAAEEARLKAEQEAKENAERIELEKQAALQREQQAKEAAAQAERDKIAAQERAKLQAEQAEARRIQAEKQAAEDAKIAAEQARQAEIARQQQEQALIEAEKKAREADRAHKSNIMRQAKESLMSNAELTESQAVDVVKAIHKQSIANVTINF